MHRVLLILLLVPAVGFAQAPTAFFDAHCVSCHGAKEPKGGLDLSALKFELDKPDGFARWVKVFDKISSGEMPPGKKKPPAAEVKAAADGIRNALLKAEHARTAADGRTRIRRLTRAEYENTVRDLFDLPGFLVKDDLPPDGTANGIDKHADALDVSHVNLQKYLEAADRVLDVAVATTPQAPAQRVYRISAANETSTLGHTVLDGDATLLKNRQPDPNYPPAGKHRHLDYGAHLSLGLHSDTSPGTSVGLFRGEDVAFRTSFAEFVALYPGKYRVRTAFWAFGWDKGKVVPATKAEVARLDAWHITGDGRGTDHPSTLLGYFDAPTEGETKVDFHRWLNPGDTFGFAFVSSNIYHQIRNAKERLMGFTGPGLGIDTMEVEGPIHDAWPPAGHKRLFGDLPLVEYKADAFGGAKPPKRTPVQQKYHGRNQPDPVKTPGVWTVKSDKPLEDADRLLASFLPRAFRRPVADDVRKTYVGAVGARLKAGDCFETAMRWAYKAALCSPDFLYHVEPEGEKGKVDSYALANRLSYFLWNSMPDDALTQLAAKGTLHDAKVLDAEVERLLTDAKSDRFRDDFLSQWLSLRKIAANDPDPKLYGGFRKDLQDAMLAETHAYFRELIDKDLGATHLIRSDFAMLNERLAKHYGVSGVAGSGIRRVGLPKDSPRGAFLTQAAILKITANGTTTSPVPRGAFVLDRLLGSPPDPPPPAVPAVEPDVRGTTTIREQLAKHRENAACAACHAKFDPPGFALESFDVIGGFRTRYQSVTDKKPPVDPSGELADGRAFKDIGEYQALVLTDPDRLTRNVAERFTVYATGRGLSFADREPMAAVVAKAKERGGGLRTLLHEVVRSELFRTR